jgi:GT2 family glycosyltransferase
MTNRVLVHILSWNSLNTHGLIAIQKSIQSIISQKSFSLGENIDLVYTDNGSAVNEIEILKNQYLEHKIKFQRFEYNFGFSGANNIVAKDFLQNNYAHFLMLNPDCCLKEDALSLMLEAFTEDRVGMVTPKLLQADLDLNPIIPHRIDSTGIIMTKSLRHFDRGNSELDINKYDNDTDVFGGTGACLLISKECMLDLVITNLNYEEDLIKVHSSLKYIPKERVDFLDEGFFAYREDADLAWRMQRFGWKCKYVPKALAYHKRVVTPEKRQTLSSEINKHGVRNRFLLQVNNYSFKELPHTILSGFIIRNILVIFAILFIERSSLPAIKEFFILFKRARERRKYIFSKSKNSNLDKWFYS